MRPRQRGFGIWPLRVGWCGCVRRGRLNLVDCPGEGAAVDAEELGKQASGPEFAQVEHGGQDSVGRGQFVFGACSGSTDLVEVMVGVAGAREQLVVEERAGPDGPARQSVLRRAEELREPRAKGEHQCRVRVDRDAHWCGDGGVHRRVPGARIAGVARMGASADLPAYAVTRGKAMGGGAHRHADLRGRMSSRSKPAQPVTDVD